LGEEIESGRGNLRFGKNTKWGGRRAVVRSWGFEALEATAGPKGNKRGKSIYERGKGGWWEKGNERVQV